MSKAPSLKQIRADAATFVAAWRDEEGYERGEAQTFVRELLAVFGITDSRAGLYEYRAKRFSTGSQGFIDAFIPGLVVIEMKSAGKDLQAAEAQAVDYLNDLSDTEFPRWVITSDFKNFRILDLENQQAGAISFSLEDLPREAEHLAFLAGYGVRKFGSAEQESASIQAAQLMADLWEELEGSGFTDHEASIFMVRTLFALYADDAAVWERDQFLEFIEMRTAPDGSDLGSALAQLYQAMARRPAERNRHLDELIARFPYVNGGIFEEQISIPSFDKPMRDLLLQCCAFNWAEISPAIFGSLFQAVKDQKARRDLGEHYTTESNILKVIGPMFLDDLRRRFDENLHDAAKLRALRRRMGQMRFLDPAAGCGNFLVVSYREMRRLDLEILQRLQALGSKKEAVSLLFLEEQLPVRLENFHGIEIEEWPAQIARTALHLVEHQANQAMALALGEGPDTLPLTKVETIYVGNALRTDWSRVVEPTEHLYVLGNPPFLGKSTRSKAQSEDLAHAWGQHESNHLDYVTGWYIKAADLLERGDYGGEFAFVSTNSVTQGEQAPSLFAPLFNRGWRIKFAHRTFTWTSEAPGAAAVHCVIVGCDSNRRSQPRLFEYPDSAHRGDPVERPVQHVINGYLADAPSVLIDARRQPLASLPPVEYGSKATDGGALLVETADVAAVRRDPIAAQYLREFVGARELVQGLPRWCLWPEDVTPSDIGRSNVLKTRVERVREMRAASPKAATREAASTPHLFQEIRLPDGDYVAIPIHVSESRRFFPVAHLTPLVVNGNANFQCSDPDGFAFALLSSSSFVTWQKAVGGRIKSDLRFSNTLTWNTFPLPSITAEQRESIIAGGQAVLDARASHRKRSLADHYNPLAMAPELLKAHKKLDKAIDAVFGLTGAVTDGDRRKALFASYEKLTAAEQLQLPRGRNGRRR